MESRRIKRHTPLSSEKFSLSTLINPLSTEDGTDNHLKMEHLYIERDRVSETKLQGKQE